MSNINELIKGNREWAEEVKKTNPKFFETLSKGQSPEYLWIGCSDSRVPANQVCGLVPGEVFVHRNVANVVSLTDLNCLSVLQFAIEVLKVKKIIVCGHYACGGVETVVRDKSYGLIDNWLTSIHEVKEQNKKFIEETLGCFRQDEENYMKKKVDVMCELNALHQALNLCKTTVVKAAWQKGLKFTIHAAIYGVADGKLYEIGGGVGSREEMDIVYDQAIASIKSRYCQ
ncbi:carbonic anhydrase [Allofrancisella guangzhouensis]|uniref:Carbonic anhydrase n=1 Tax=Allofrancisella guangzhouensis TaxID=594679 RepID=A0A0A8E6G5_9GAMM|nr:carbonic anhydrase [Allofrancisella guangzhouensis]KEI35648.1 carbonic anhydrase [Francisella sp. W12-1067]AJC49544.1 carbonate dehydratase [Allofrancisella guangzhouensis]MBK2027140.1 carbonic anhydrase [Allofrancisella guangzhouensis]MBK2044478.1 carbonic anhydrase [Allofrancisella guangzhouensis]MBK2046023.1 carbonic anhydrase [Allofrancisella guangzhouensis]